MPSFRYRLPGTLPAGFMLPRQNVHIYIYTHVCVYIYIYTYVNIYIYIYIRRDNIKKIEKYRVVLCIRSTLYLDIRSKSKFSVFYVQSFRIRDVCMKYMCMRICIPPTVVGIATWSYCDAFPRLWQDTSIRAVRQIGQRWWCVQWWTCLMCIRLISINADMISGPRMDHLCFENQPGVSQTFPVLLPSSLAKSANAYRARMVGFKVSGMVCWCPPMQLATCQHL